MEDVMPRILKITLAIALSALLLASVSLGPEGFAFLFYTTVDLLPYIIVAFITWALTRKSE